MSLSTIAAISTPLGTGGIGIIKISGPRALSIADTLFRASQTPRPDKKPPVFRSHHLYHGHVVDPATGDRVDEVLLAFMQAPHSYTREDIIEIQAHSGIATLSRILSLVLENGARLAEPGEFTKRAFLNGRLTLDQAESVIDIIESKSDQALRMAMTQMNGTMHKQIQSLRQHLLDYLALIETAIDFIEDPDDTIIDSALPRRIQTDVEKELRRLITQYQRAHLYREGIKMAIVGKPNVGKSSLLNCLIKKDRAIVTEIPGTTRDLIEESVTIQGIPILVIDTAGVRDGGDPIEQIGIKKTRACIAEADLVLFMTDASGPLDDNDHRIFDLVKGQNTIIVSNKTDRLSPSDGPCLPDRWADFPVVAISVRRQTGLEKLESAVRQSMSVEDGRLGENPIVPNLRQHQLIQTALQATHRLIEALTADAPLEIAAVEAGDAINALGQITGESIDDTLVDRIFSRFCIGK